MKKIYPSSLLLLFLFIVSCSMLKRTDKEIERSLINSDSYRLSKCFSDSATIKSFNEDIYVLSQKEQEEFWNNFFFGGEAMNVKLAKKSFKDYYSIFMFSYVDKVPASVYPYKESYQERLIMIFKIDKKTNKILDVVINEENRN